MNAHDIIHLLGLEPLPVEGGYFRETWRSEDEVSPASLPVRYRAARAFGSAIYYLLTAEPDCFSAMHRLASDEVYHFYLGDPVEMLLLSEGGNARRIVLGSDIAAGELVQYVVRRGVWQGSRLVPGGRFALLGTTMAPAFDPQDYEPGSRDELINHCPEQAELIRVLTR